MTRNSSPCGQAKDDPELLEGMMADLRASPEIYHPGNYWTNYERYVLPELRRHGLHDFRRRGDTLFNTFGAVDLIPSTLAVARNPRSRRLGLRKGLARWALKIPVTRRGLDQIGSMMRGGNLADHRRLRFSYARWYGAARGARPLEALNASIIGNPEDLFVMGDNTYTLSILRYYLEYAYCCHFVQFDALSSVMEIGSGMGKQVEVLRKLHGRLCFYLFDIPPQIYVCEQYLSAVFPGSVVGYRETRRLARLPAPEPGKIFIFGTWRLPELAGLSWDLHWNSTSYEEMEAGQTLNFLKYVNSYTSHHVFLQERMEGMVQARAAGKHGVLTPTRLEHYRQGLPAFQMLDLSDGPDPTTWSSFQCSLWKRTDCSLST